MGNFRFCNFGLLISLILICCCCKRIAYTSIQLRETIDLSSSLKSYEILPLSSIASGINYVILENSDEAYFRERSNTFNHLYKIYDSIIFITDGEKLISFDLAGRFVRQFGTLGRGPGEFIDISDFAVNPETREVLILSAGLRKIFIYSFEGEFAGQINLDFDPISMRIFGNRLVFTVLCGLRTFSNYNTIVITDFSGNRERELLYRPEEKAFPGDGSKGLLGKQAPAVVNNRYCYWENIYDTIYGISESFDEIIATPINLGKDRIPQDYLSPEKYRFTSLEELKRFKSVQSLLMTDSYYFFEVFNKGGLARIVVFRDSLKSYNLHYIEDSTNKVRKAFQNDLDNLMHFWPLGTLSSNMLVGFAHGATLRPYLEKENQNINDETSAGKLIKQLSDPVFNESTIMIIVTLK